MSHVGLSPPFHTLLLLQFGIGGCEVPEGAELPHAHPAALGGFIHRIIPCSRVEEKEEEALLLPINSLPFSPRCHSLFLMSPMAAPRPAHAASARAGPRRGLSPLPGHPGAPQSPAEPGGGGQDPPSTPRSAAP